MKRGQTMVEYILVFVLLLTALTITHWLVRAVNRQTERSSILLGSEYP